jgi:hypothetical protein
MEKTKTREKEQMDTEGKANNMSELPLLCGYRQSRVVQLLMIYFWVMVFNTTFNNISVISWRSVLLMEKTGVPRENLRSIASH